MQARPRELEGGTLLRLPILGLAWSFDFDGAFERARPALINQDLLPIDLLGQRRRANLISIEVQRHGVHDGQLSLS